MMIFSDQSAGSLGTSAEVLRKTKVPGTFHTFLDEKTKKVESSRAATMQWKSAGHSSDIEAKLST